MMYLKFLLVSLFASTAVNAGEETSKKHQVISVSEEQFPQSGILRNIDGFIYLDVSDNYIHELVSLIEEEGFEKPPYFEGNKKAGAHISLISPQEMKKYGVEKIDELGKQYFFLIKDCAVVHPPTWKGVDSVCIITLEAPDLDALREKYGLPKVKYAFHITIGIKYEMEESA